MMCIRLKLLVPLIMAIAMSCDGDFENLNDNPAASNTLGSEFLLARNIGGVHRDRFVQWRANLIINSQWCQHLSTVTTSFAYDAYDTRNEQYTGAYFERMIPEFLKEMQDVISRNEGEIMGAMSLLSKVHMMVRMADMYGAIPYEQAGKPDEFTKPSYDQVEDLYGYFIRDIRTAISWLKAGIGKNPGDFDVMYRGDIDKWLKFAHSMLLRYGLRLSEVAPELSRSIVAEAIEGGVISTIDETAFVHFSGTVTDGTRISGVSEVFVDFPGGGHDHRMSEFFVDFLQDHNDPRTTTLIRTYNSLDEIINESSSGHKGIPAGSFSDLQDSSFAYAQPRLDVMVAANAPIVVMGLAEVEFNKAEAIARGWVNGDAKATYENGVVAACKIYESIYPNAPAISDSSIQAYLQEPEIAYDANAQNTLDTALVRINNQKWLTLFLDGYEAFANTRRLDIPKLTPVAAEFRAPESDGSIPKRVRYPVSEKNVNTLEYNKAIDTQGEDNINTRLWWDMN